MGPHASGRAAAFALISVLAHGCGDSPAPSAPSDAATPTDAVTPADAPTPAMGVEAILRMCRMNNACGYQTRHQLPADLCATQALERLAGRAEVDPPEHRIHFARMVECAATATSCDAYVRCADFDVACSGMARATCTGTVRNACSTPGGNFQPRTFDCARLGGVCTDGECLYPDTGATCDTPGNGRCDGNVRVWCRRSAMAGRNTELRDPCPAGTACVGGGSSVGCYPVTPCAAPASRCDGDTAVLCTRDNTSGMVELRSDCASVGRRCAVDARGRASCVPRATGCAAPMSGTSATCDGAAVRVCLEGVDTRLDCAPLGRTMCAGSPASCR